MIACHHPDLDCGICALTKQVDEPEEVYRSRMRASANPRGPHGRADLTPLYTLLSDGRWWRLFEITAGLDLPRRTTQRRLDHAVEEGWVEKTCNGFRLIGTPPPVRRAGGSPGLPYGADGRVVPMPQLPVLSMADLQMGAMPGRPRQPWWPGVSDRCEACGGRLVLEPPIGRVPGSLLCLSAGHEAAEVRP